MTLDALMDRIAQLPADDVETVMRSLLNDINGSPLNYAERLAIMKFITGRLTEACRRRDALNAIAERESRGHVLQ